MPPTRTLSVELRADISSFETQLRRASDLVQRFDTNMRQADRAGGQGFTSSTEAMRKAGGAGVDLERTLAATGTRMVDVGGKSSQFGSRVGTDLDGAALHARGYGNAWDDVDRKTTGTFGRIRDNLTKISNLGIGFAVGNVLVGTFHRVVAGIEGAIMAGSSLNETISKTGFVFGAAQGEVLDFADDMAKRYGLVKQATLDAAASVGLIGKASGLSQQDAAKLGMQFTTLAADASSFFDVDPNDAMERLRSGLVGETEPMRQFGVLLDEARVKQEGWRLGLARTGDELTSQQKIQARASLIIAGMADASGDLERTSGSLANRLRAISGHIQNFAADLGVKAQPAILGILDSAYRLGQGGLDVLAAGFARLSPFLHDVVDIGRDVGSIFATLVEAGAPVAGMLLGLVGVGVISGLNALASGLSAVTGFLAEHEEIVRALAIAYGVTLIPRMVEAGGAAVSFGVAMARAAAADSVGALARIAHSFVTIAPAAEAAAAATALSGAAGVTAGAEVAAGSVVGSAGLAREAVAAKAVQLELFAVGAAGTAAGAQIAAGAAAGSTGFLATLGRLRFGIGAIGLAVGAGVFAISKGWERNAKDADEFIESTFGKGPQSGAVAMRGHLNELIDSYNALTERTKGDGISMFGKTLSGPGQRVDSERRDAIARQIDIERKAYTQYADTLTQVAKVQGITVTQAESLAMGTGVDLAEGADKANAAFAKLGLSMHVPPGVAAQFTDLAAAIGLTPKELQDISTESGLSLDAIRGLSEQGIADFAKLADSVSKVKDAFSGGFDPIDLLLKFAEPVDFTGLEAQKQAIEDQQKAQDEAAKGTKSSASSSDAAARAAATHTTAVEKLAEAHHKLEELQRSGKATGLQLEAAQHRVAQAQRAVELSADKAADAQTKAAGAQRSSATEGDKFVLTAERIRSGYLSIITNAQQFNADLAELTKRGLNPEALLELSQKPPEQAASFVKALLSDTSGTLIDLANLASATLDNLLTKQARLATLMAIAQQPGQRGRQLQADLPTAVRIDEAAAAIGPGATYKQVQQRTGLDPEVLHRVALEFQAELEGENEILADIARKTQPLKALSLDIEVEAQGVAQSVGLSLERGADTSIKRFATAVTTGSKQQGVAAFRAMSEQFSPEKAREVAQTLSANLAAKGDLEGAMKLRNIIDVAALGPQLEFDANIVLDRLGATFKEKKEANVPALASALSTGNAHMIDLAFKDLKDAVGREKADAVIRSLMLHLKSAGDKAGVLHLRGLLDAEELADDLKRAADRAFNEFSNHVDQGAQHALDALEHSLVRGGGAASHAAFSEMKRRFGPREAQDIVRSMAEQLRAAGQIPAAIQLESLLDIQHMRTLVKRDVDAVVKEMKLKLRPGGQDALDELVKSIKNASGPAMARARDDLITAFGKDKADAIINNMILKLTAAGNLVGAIKLRLAVDTEFRMQNAVLQSENGVFNRSNISPGGMYNQGAEGMLHFAGRSWNAQGDLRNAHQPEIANAGTYRGWAEAETGGELYAPLANDHRRPAALRYMSQAAEIMGHALLPKSLVAHLDRDTVRLADGGLLGRFAGGLTQRRERGTSADVAPSAAPLRGRATRHEAVEQPPVGTTMMPTRALVGEILAQRPHEIGHGRGTHALNLHAFATGGITMRPSTSEDPGFYPWAARAIGAVGVQRPNILEAIAARGTAAYKRWFDAASQGGAGGTVAPSGPVPGNLAAWIRLAMGIVGVPASWLGPLEVIAMHESGGNPHAINNWDSNAQRGDPSRGLMQTIGSTFRAHMLPGHGDIWNPVDNAIAAIRYIQGRYHDISRVPGIASMARGGPYKGYAEGGITRALREGASPRPLVLPRLTSQRAAGPDRGELRGPVPKRSPYFDTRIHASFAEGGIRTTARTLGRTEMAPIPISAQVRGDARTDTLRAAAFSLPREVGAAGLAQPDRALRLARVTPPAQMRRGVDRQLVDDRRRSEGLRDPSEALGKGRPELGQRLIEAPRRGQRPLELERVDLHLGPRHERSLSPRRFAEGGLRLGRDQVGVEQRPTVEQYVAQAQRRQIVVGQPPRRDLSARVAAQQVRLADRVGEVPAVHDRYAEELRPLRRVRIAEAQPVPARPRIGRAGIAPRRGVEEVGPSHAASLSPRQYAEGALRAQGEYGRAVVGGARAFNWLAERPSGATYHHRAVSPTTRVPLRTAGSQFVQRRVEQASDALPLKPRGRDLEVPQARSVEVEAQSRVGRFGHVPSLSPRRFADGGLRHGPERQRDEPTTYAGRAPLGVHLATPTAARHAAQAMPPDSRREAVRWPAVQAGIPAVEAHDLHTRIVEPRRSTSTAVTTTAGFAPDLAQNRRWAAWPTPGPSGPLRATEALRARGPGPAVPSLRDVKAIRVDRVESIRIPSFAKGGIMPGPRGEPGLAVLHGGEPVLPLHAQPIQTYPIHPVGGGATSRALTVELKVERVISGDVTPEKAVAMMKREIREYAEGFVAGHG